jgi:hypothetical protein
MTLDASGNLGVGITAPVPYNPGARIIQSHNSSGGASELKITNATTGTSASAGFTLIQSGLDTYVWNGSNSFMAFGTNNTERARIDSSGRLLVGATSDVKGGANNKSVIEGNYTGQYGLALVSTQTSGTGNFQQFVYNGSVNGSISSNGTTTTYATTSDYRLKTVIGPVTNAGQRIDALQPVEYTWNSNGSQTRGFLAHQFQEVYAGSVSGTKDAVDAEGNPKYQSMQAGSAEVIADLVAEIQSLRQRLAAAGI